MTADAVIAIAPERFVLETVLGGGLLLDLESGILFNLNDTAALVWKHALAGKRSSEITSQLVARFDVSRSVAAVDVDTALALPQTHAFAPRPMDFEYQSDGENFRFLVSGVPVLEIAASGRALRALPAFNPADVGLYLRSIAPKVVALLGTSVLHASAVARPDGGIVAFLGASGAGKTTTARAFGRAGWRLVCEDKLVLSADGQQLAAVPDGETRIAAWIEKVRNQLVSARPQDWCDTDALSEVAKGPEQPLVDVILVDSARRRGSSIEVLQLGPVGAAGQIFKHGFYGSPAAKEWRRQVSVAAAIARTARTFEATMPHGLESLERAARDYKEMTAS